MINSFKQYLVEEEKIVYFTFGRMNPPTIGHGKLIDKLASMAGRNPYRIFVSQSQDPKKNPLNYSDKIKNIRKMFPKHARNVMINKDVKSAMDILPALYNQGFRKVVMVVGSDRINEFEALLNKYNGQEGRHGFYNFSDIKVASAGERDPDAEGIEGMSASKMRSFASDNDFTSFSQGLPKTVSTKDARKLFNDVRKGMGLKEERTFKNHIQLAPISSTREAFVEGHLFNLGESVIVKKTDEVGTITVLGSNYVIVESSDGKRTRHWLDAVEKIEEQDNKKSMYKDKPDWGTPESTKKWKKATPGQDVDEGTDRPNIWDNIRARRAAGKPKLKPGQKGYPKTLDLPENQGTCWPGYVQVGMKKKNGKMVPNCVKEKLAEKIQVRQDPDIDELPGSQPATFQKGIQSKSTKAARHRHFQRMTKRADDDPTAYQDAPGDKEARKKGTRPSQYTLKYKRMFGEQKDPIDAAKLRVQRQKEIAARRHDQIMDRARLLQAKQKNQETE